MRVRLCSILAALLLSACAGPQIHHGQLQLLDKGMSEAAVASKLVVPPLAIHRQKVDGREFEFEQYRLNNGVQLDTYLIAFENGKLIYWGYIDEFRRQPDVALSKAAGAAAREILSKDR